MAMIEFGEYLPDIPPVGNPGLVLAKNCLPYEASYQSLPNLANLSTNAIGGVARGMVSTRDITGTAYTYAGDVSKLYRLSTSTFYDATRSVGGAYSTDAADAWEFEVWGNHVIATNYADVIQDITLGASNFAALAGSPPKARHIAVVKDFLVLGNVTDYSSGAAVPNRVHWSGFDNINTWTPSQSTQCDLQDLQGNGGAIKRIVGGEYGTIFQEQAIWRMTYVGPPLIFQFDLLEAGQGTPAPNSVVKTESMIYFLGHDDFYVFNGAASQSIAQGKVYRTFKEDLDSAYIYNVWGAHDSTKPFVLWAYPGAGNIGGKPNKLLIYNHLLDKWAIAELTIEVLGTYFTEGYTLDTLDSVSSSVDALPFTLDSPIWSSRNLNITAFDNNHRFSTFSGDALTAVFETGDKQLTPGKVSFVSNTRPYVEGVSASVSVSISGRFNQDETASFNSTSIVNSSGEAPTMNEARFHRFRVTVADGFNHTQGIDIEHKPRGRY